MNIMNAYANLIIEKKYDNVDDLVNDYIRTVKELNRIRDQHNQSLSSYEDFESGKETILYEKLKNLEQKEFLLRKEIKTHIRKEPATALKEKRINNIFNYYYNTVKEACKWW